VSRLAPVLFSIAFLWMTVSMIPAPPQAPGVGIDASWAYGINLAHAKNLNFGRDVVFTFGPLGYLLYPVPGLVAALPAFSYAWAVHLVFLVGAFLLWRSLGNTSTVLFTWVTLSAAMLLSDLPFERLLLSFVSVAIGTQAQLARKGYVSSVHLAFVGLMAGVIPLFRSSDGLEACTIFYALLGSALVAPSQAIPHVPEITWRELLTCAAAPPAAFTLGYAFVEHGVSGLWSYVAGSMQIVLGYSEAMAQPGPAYQIVAAGVSLVVLVLVIPMLVHRPDFFRGILPAFIVAFFACKSGLVRQDAPHADLIQVKIAVASLFVLVCLNALRDRRLVTSWIFASLLFGTVVHIGSSPSREQAFLRRALLTESVANLSASLNAGSTWDQTESLVWQRLSRLRVDVAVADAVSGGTVDDVPSETDVVYANRWHWRPRPVFQSYSAYTPALDQMNAAHLDGRDTADHIIMQWGDIDDRHPLLDDTASWRALFDKYDPEIRRTDFLVLKHRVTSRYRDPQLLGSVTATWYSDVSVPNSEPAGLTMMRAELNRGLYGVLLGALFRNSPVYLHATCASGVQSRWRVNRANLRDGALVAYLPQTLGEVAPYFGQAGANAPDRVTSIRFETPGPLEFSKEIRVEWYKLSFSDGSKLLSASIPAIHSVQPVGPLANLLRGETRSFIDDVNGQSVSATPISSPRNALVAVKGWAVDTPSHQPASAVYLDVDGQLFPTTYGDSRPDVAAALSDSGYEKCGFQGVIDAGPGDHRVLLRIVDAAGRGYYLGPSFLLYVQ
jgi:hypothetical protein